MVDITLVRSANSIIYDPRVRKIIGSLSKKYSTSAVGWNRDGISQEKINNYVIKLELFNLKTSFWKPSLIRILIRLIVFFPPFWMWIFVKLLRNRPRVVYACDLDTFLPCYIYKLLFRKKLIFDVFDRYGMALIPQRFKKLCSLINFLEELSAKHSDALIIAGGEKVLRTFHKIPNCCEILLNCPSDYFNYSGKQKSELCPDTDQDFKIVYTGVIKRERALENVVDAIRDLEFVSFVMAGPVIDVDLLHKIKKFHGAKYLGLLQPTEALSLEASSNVLVALYNPRVMWNMMTLPNKLFEAMMCGIPIITNIARDIVNETGCGIIVEYDNIKQIKESIMTLRDNPDLCKKLGDNGRKAFLEKYNWKVMEQKLYKICDNLLKIKN